jgi:ABC-type arginine/histidine transport system permease subunit
MGLYVALLQYPLVYRGATAIPGSVHWCYCNILQCTVVLLQYPLVYSGATAIPGSVHWCYCNILQCTVALLQYPLVYRGATAISSSVPQYPLQYPPVPAGSVL